MVVNVCLGIGKGLQKDEKRGSGINSSGFEHHGDYSWIFFLCSKNIKFLKRQCQTIICHFFSSHGSMLSLAKRANSEL
jgi:hypothetical protein